MRVEALAKHNVIVTNFILGKGIVASEDVKKGTLLFVEKPFVSTVLARKSRLVKPLSHLTPSEVTERVLMHGHGLLLCGFGNHSCLRKL